MRGSLPSSSQRTSAPLDLISSARRFRRIVSQRDVRVGAKGARKDESLSSLRPDDPAKAGHKPSPFDELTVDESLDGVKLESVRNIVDVYRDQEASSQRPCSLPRHPSSTSPRCLPTQKVLELLVGSKFQEECLRAMRSRLSGPAADMEAALRLATRLCGVLRTTEQREAVIPTADVAAAVAAHPTASVYRSVGLALRWVQVLAPPTRLERSRWQELEDQALLPPGENPTESAAREPSEHG